MDEMAAVSSDPAFINEASAACEVEAAVATAYKEAASLIQAAQPATQPPDDTPALDAIQRSWASGLVHMTGLAYELSKEWHMRLLPRCMSYMLRRRHHGNGQTDFWTELVFWDQCDEAKPAYVGRLVNLDDKKRIIYSLPSQKRDFTSDIASGSLVFLIRNIGCDMARTPAEHRNSLPSYFHWARTFYDILISEQAALSKRAVIESSSSSAALPNMSKQELLSTVLHSSEAVGNALAHPCTFCKSIIKSGEVVRYCPLCLHAWHQQCQKHVGLALSQTEDAASMQRVGNLPAESLHTSISQVIMGVCMFV
jgi:hypothetical protein